MKFGCPIGIFLNSAQLICRSTDISKCFRESLRLRDNESRLYLETAAMNGHITKSEYTYVIEKDIGTIKLFHSVNLINTSCPNIE